MNLPTNFTIYTRTLLGEEGYDGLLGALEQDSPVSIRLNTSKKEFSPMAIEGLVPIPWCTTGYYLPERLTFTFDPLFHAGCYYVQEASSMFLEKVMKQYVHTPSVMLDLCAAPGGKSTHACSLLPSGSLLVANEVIRSRSQILAENLTKWGQPNVVVTNNDPTDFSTLDSFFDVILADVPCSGEGMFRKDAGAIEEWSLDNVEICWQRQRRIIADVWPSLKPGGILIYSTCTYNTKEDEENIAWIQQEFGGMPLEVDVPEEWHISGNLANRDFPVYRFLPHKTVGEGFFLAVLRKPDLEDADCRFGSAQRKIGDKRNKGSKLPSPNKEVLNIVKDWIVDSDNYQLIANDRIVSAFPQSYFTELGKLQQALRIVQAGVALAEMKGKDIIPNHALAMSLIMRSGIFHTEEIGYEQAIAYLRKEAITLSDTSPRGCLLVTYKGSPLGFVKNIGNRANNLYPQEWRIRSGYLPQEVRTL